MDDIDVYIEPEESDRDRVISTQPIVITDYSAHARNVLQSAELAALTAPGGIMTCEHVLLSLAADRDSAAAQVMSSCGFDSEAITRTIAFIGGSQPVSQPAAEVTVSPRAQRVLAAASIEAGNRSAARIDTLHLLFALIRERQGIAATALETPGVAHEMIGVALSNAMRNGVTDPS